MRTWFAGVCGVFLTASVWAGDSLVSIGDQKYLTGNYPGGRIKFLKYPTLGCPAIVKAGDGGTAWIKFPNGGSTTSFQLSIVPTGDAMGKTYALTTTGLLYDSTIGTYKVSYSVASDVPEDTYDLKLSIPDLSVADVQYNCLRVVKQETGTYTFMVIADPQQHDPQGILWPSNYNAANYNVFALLQQAIQEIRALNPTFAIVCGDMMFGLEYDFEYESVWNTWKSLGVPLFMVPGNHDGYASIKERTLLGITSPKRDGLDHWRKYFGPNYYSFKFGGLHFQAVNSMDGTPERRDGFLIITENWGGDLLPAQMDWISADLAGAAGTVVPFMHHHPMGPYRPNGTFSLWSWIFSWIWKWITTGDLMNWPGQEWNTKATGEFLLQKYAQVPIAFIGHSHIDDQATYGNTLYRQVTSLGSDSGDYWGYSPAKVQDSKITDHIYLNEKFQSVPAGNLFVKVTDSDGASQAAEIKSGLSKSYEVTIEFLMPPAEAYSAENGTVVQWASVDAETMKVWVRAATPVAEGIEKPKTTVVTVATSSSALAGSVEVAADTGGSCGAPLARGHALGFLLLLLAPLGWLLLRRRDASV